MRNLVILEENYSILVLCWEPNQERFIIILVIILINNY